MDVKGITAPMDYGNMQKSSIDVAKSQQNEQKGLEFQETDADNMTKDSMKLDKKADGKTENENGKDAELSADEKAKLEKEVEKMNKLFGIFNKKFEMRIHEQTKRVMVKMINSDTGETVTEYPPKKILDMIAQMQETVGLVVDKKV